MNPKIDELKQRLGVIGDLHSAAAVLGWDQATYMPPGGGEARGRQIATLERLAHEKFTHPSIGRMLSDLRSHGGSLPYDSDDAALLRVTQRDYERAVKVPSAFVAKFSAHSAATYEAWVKARPANDFASMRPMLEKTLDYSRELANFFPGYDHIADPLIDFADYGMKAATVSALSAELRTQLVPLVHAITAQPVADDSCIRQNFPEAQQLEFGREVVKQLGYDFERGRQDKTRHPFCTKF